MDISKYNVSGCHGHSLCSCSVQAGPLPTPFRVTETESAMQNTEGSWLLWSWSSEPKDIDTLITLITISAVEFKSVSRN